MNAANSTDVLAKITKIRIEGLRSLEDVTLDLDGLTVLIGSNGSGKSGIVEACELLRRVASPNFIDEFYKIHGGFAHLLRHGCHALTLKVAGERYSKEMHSQFSYTLYFPDNPALIRETMAYTHKSMPLASRAFAVKCTADRHRNHVQYTWTDPFDFTMPIEPTMNTAVKELLSDELLLTSYSPTEGLTPLANTFHFIQNILKDIDVHVPFDVTARWARKAFRKPSELRESAESAPTTSLAMTGYNLVNAYHALKNDFSSAHWEETMDYVRLGLGNDIDSINTRVGGNGDMGLSIKYHLFDKQVATSALSDGELAYLAFVAMFRLNRNKSLLVFDEPDLHLHPKLTMRVLDLFESMAADGMPIIITTHSDRLLDGLRDPAKSVVLCELNHKRATELFRPDPEALAEWLTDYRGIGAIRSDGHEASILTEKVVAKPTDAES